MIHLATSYTPGYPWIERYATSLREHYADNWFGHRVMEPPRDTRTWCIQNGAFLEHLLEHGVSDYGDPVIAFTDADMICQRPWSAEEEWDLRNLRENQVAMGVNQRLGATLEDEAKDLGQLVDDSLLDRIFPGWRRIPVWNCGFIVARRSTFQRLHDLTTPLMLPAESCFSHYATIQWVICYAVGRWLNHVLLPETICVHGLCGRPPNTTADEEGNVYVNGTMAAFRHAINLSPHKCCYIEPSVSSRKRPLETPAQTARP